MSAFEARTVTHGAHEAMAAQAVATIDQFTTTGWEHVRENRDELRDSLLYLGGYTSLQHALENIGSRTVIPIIAGGIATRWEKSFASEGAKAVLEDPAYTVAPGKPRGLTRVPNRLPRNIWPHDSIPVFGYTLWETRDIPGARRVVIHSEEATEQDLLDMQQTAETLGLQIELRAQTRRANNPKPSGHGDAIVQNIDILEGADYVLPQFVSDASSPATIKDTMLALNVLSRSGLGVDVVVPTVHMEQPKYSVFVDNKGLVRKMGHAKLLGEGSLKNADSSLLVAGSQIGIYPFTATSLWEESESAYSRYLNDRSFVFLPGHQEGVNEFAIDDAVLSLAAKGRVRQLAIAQESEITSSAKTVEALPEYVQMMERAIIDSGLTPQY